MCNRIVPCIGAVLYLFFAIVAFYRNNPVCIPYEHRTGPHGLAVAEPACASVLHRFVPLVVVDCTLQPPATLINETTSLDDWVFPRLNAYGIVWSSDGKALASCIFQENRLTVTVYTRPSLDAPKMTVLFVHVFDYTDDPDDGPTILGVSLPNEDGEVYLDVVADRKTVILRRLVSSDRHSVSLPLQA